MYNIIGSKIIIEYIYGHLYISGSSLAFNTFRSSSLPNHYFLLWKLQSAFFFFCKSQIFQILGLEAPLSCNCMKCHRAVKAAMERNVKDIVDFNSTFPIILWLNFAQ